LFDSLWKGANRKDSLFRIHQAHLLRATSPIRSPTSRARLGRLGANQLRKLGLDRFGHFGTQSTLQVRGAHVLRRLINAHGGRGKVGRSLGSLMSGNVRTMAATDAHLMQHHRLVSTANSTVRVFVSCRKDLHVLAQKDLKHAQYHFIGRARQYRRQHASSSIGQNQLLRNGMRGATGQDIRATIATFIVTTVCAMVLRQI
jgi:hypothetical protein